MMLDDGFIVFAIKVKVFCSTFEYMYEADLISRWHFQDIIFWQDKGK